MLNSLQLTVDMLLSALQCGQPAATAAAERSLEAAGQYAAAAKEVAAAKGLPALDLFTKLQAIPDWQGLLSDGLHFNPNGSGAVYDLLVALLRSELPQFRWDCLPLFLIARIHMGCSTHVAVSWFELHVWLQRGVPA